MTLVIGRVVQSAWFDQLPVEIRLKYFKLFVLWLTFLCYIAYHQSRRPISVIKTIWHRQNCSVQDPDGFVVTVSNVSRCSWSPFDREDYNELFGGLDYAFLLSYAFGMFACGHLAERLHIRYFLGIGMIVSGLLCMLNSLPYWLNWHSYVFLVLVQIVSGLFQASGWPSVVTCVANWYGNERKGFIMGIWNSHTSIGNIVGGLIAGYFVMDNWGMSFLIPGAIMVAVGFVVLMVLPPYPAEVLSIGRSKTRSDSMDSAKKPLIDHVDCDNHRMPSNSAAEAPYRVMIERVRKSGFAAKDSSSAISITNALRIPGVVAFSLCLFFAKLVSYTFLFWLPMYIKHSAHYQASFASEMATIFDVGGIVGGVAAGAAADAGVSSALVCATMLTMATPLLYCYSYYASASLAANVAFLVALGMLINGPYSLITTAVSANLGMHPSLSSNAKALATVTSIIDGTGSFGAALGPLLTGILAYNQGWNSVFKMLLISEVVACGISWWMVFRHRFADARVSLASHFDMFVLTAVVGLSVGIVLLP